jgi:hypothetical protein
MANPFKSQSHKVFHRQQPKKGSVVKTSAKKNIKNAITKKGKK